MKDEEAKGDLDRKRSLRANGKRRIQREMVLIGKRMEIMRLDEDETHTLE
jgi:hypothetical protein